MCQVAYWFVETHAHTLDTHKHMYKHMHTGIHRHRHTDTDTHRPQTQIHTQTQTHNTHTHTHTHTHTLGWWRDQTEGSSTIRQLIFEDHQKVFKQNISWINFWGWGSSMQSN